MLKYGGCSKSVPTKTRESPTDSRRTWAFAPLCSRVCRSGRDLGVVVERSVLLNSLALCLVVDVARQTARSAPAEKGGSGIRVHPGPMVTPRATRFMKAATRNGQPSLAGGMEVRALRGPTRRSVFFSWTGRGPFSFCQEQKENGGRIVAANAAFPAPQSGALQPATWHSPSEPDRLP